MFRHRKRSGGAPGWMVVYSDMVTLLLAFFVLLYSFSAIDVDKFRQFISSFQGRGILDGGQVELPGPDTDFPIDDSDLGDEEPFWANTDQLLAYIERYLREHGLDGMVELSRDERGVHVELRDHLLFAPGRAEITAEGRQLLRKLTPLLEEIPNRVLVEGHTDTVPINTVQFPSNWELSGARASSVIRYFTEQKGLDPKRFIAVGYGEFSPIADNDTAEGRARNRRVAMVIRSK